jgi:hypothetical protein
MYYIAEVLHNSVKVVDSDQDFNWAEYKAVRHSGKYAITVEILDECLRPLKQICENRDY